MPHCRIELLRALFPQPGGFEGLGVAWEIAEAENFGVPKRDQLRELVTAVQSCAPDPSGEFAQREDRIAEVPNVVESNLQLEVHSEPLPSPPEAGVPSK